jgi:hypothetical protein
MKRAAVEAARIPTRGDQFRDNTATARGAADDQYTREERVIKQTIPNKGNLANTGGPPLLLIVSGKLWVSSEKGDA